MRVVPRGLKHWRTNVSDTDSIKHFIQEMAKKHGKDYNYALRLILANMRNVASDLRINFDAAVRESYAAAEFIKGK